MAHRVSGLMLANHTSIATVSQHFHPLLSPSSNVALLTWSVQLFKRIFRQYEGMRKRNAFLDGYKKTAPFSDGLSEFDEAREVVADLIAEYEAAEDANYLTPDLGEQTSAETDKRMG
jgi:tubulin gamma